MNQKAAVSKELNAKHRKILEALLRLPENKECADCKSRSPRWASVNLGIFICLQCSGIHRSLGVHISKVRSATLDTWLPDQIAFIQSIGNEKSNSYWEAELPPNYNRVGIENFIRAKYEDKKWISREVKSNLPPKVNDEKVVASKNGTQIMNQSFPPPQISVFAPPGKPEHVIASVPKLKEFKQISEPAIANGKLSKIQITSKPKVDYATDLFSMLSVDESRQNDATTPATTADNINHQDNNNNSWAVFNSSENETSMVEEINSLKEQSKNETHSEFGDLFQDLQWNIVPPLAIEQAKDPNNDIMNLFETSRPGIGLSNMNGNRSNGVDSRSEKWGNSIGNQEASRKMVMRNSQSNGSFRAQPKIPSQLGGDYDFSSLLQGTFTKR